jgi:hypothetical protein
MCSQDGSWHVSDALLNLIDAETAAAACKLQKSQSLQSFVTDLKAEGKSLITATLELVVGTALVLGVLRVLLAAQPAMQSQGSMSVTKASKWLSKLQAAKQQPAGVAAFVGRCKSAVAVA